MQRHWRRYNLRTLLMGVALLALALSWWIRPRTLAWHRPDGTLAAEFRLRRNWRGEFVGCGTQAWYLGDGQCFRQQQVAGALWQNGAFVGPGDFGDPVYPPHRPPDPPTEEYVAWLVRDRVPISTDLPRSAGEIFSYP